MTFQLLMEKYIKNSSCNIDQAKFIWNAAIEECLDKLSSNDTDQDTIKSLIVK